MKVLIAGGGITGLTTALTLHRAGHQVEVFESVAKPAELGVGINLLPHAVRILFDLGLEDELNQLGIQTTSLSFYSGDGIRIWSEPRGLVAGNPWPQYSIHRGRLLGLLYRTVFAQLGESVVHTGHHFDSFEQDSDSVTATFVNKATGDPVGSYTGDVLIGADGLHSRLRKVLHPDDGPPYYSGLVLWRGAIETEPYLDGKSMFMAGDENSKVVVYPIGAEEAGRGKSLVNWIAELPVEVDVEKADWNREVDVETFIGSFEDWDFGWINLPQLFRESSTCYEFPMVDRHPLSRWSFGRVTLLGDAAHAMRPNGSNGASQGILDAEAIATHLSANDDPAQALSDYQAERLKPTAELTLTNRNAGPEKVMQWVADSCQGTCVGHHTCVSQEDLEVAAIEYKQLAGFDPERLSKSAESR